MKKIGYYVAFVCTFMIMTLFIYSPYVQAAESDYNIIASKTNVAVDKVFKINFNYELNKQIPASNVVQVIDDKGQAVQIKASYGSDNKSIVVAPSTQYEYGKAYTLITKNVTSSKGVPLKKPVKMQFTTVSAKNANFKVCIDAGNGGNDPSDFSGSNGIKKSQVNLGVALKLGKLLQDKGMQVVYTRTSDVFLDLPSRFKIANDNNADFFISLHCNNADNNNAATGNETYYLEGNSAEKSMAEYVQEELGKVSGIPNRGAKIGSKPELSGTNSPGVKVYLGFINNPEEEKLMASDDFQNKSAQAMANAISRYSISMGDKDKITSIDNINAKVKVGEKYVLPSSVAAIMGNNTKKEVAVAWNPKTVDTSKPGIFKYEGTVEGYDNKVMLNLSVISSSYTICIDPGHGGYDPGAVGPTGVKEKNVSLPIALKVGNILSQKGINVIYTRTTDAVSWPSVVREDLLARCKISNDAKADYFVSVHCNAFNGAAHGTETYYYQGNAQGQKLAQSVQNSLVAANGLYNRGLKTANYSVLCNTDAIAILTEVGFIDNPTEEKLLNDPAYQIKCAEAIAKGILNFLGISN